MNFATVEFFATNNARSTIAIVPIRWLSREEDEVWWPPVSSSKPLAMAKRNVPVGKNWKKRWSEYWVKHVGYFISIHTSLHLFYCQKNSKIY